MTAAHTVRLERRRAGFYVWRLAANVGHVTRVAGLWMAFVFDGDNSMRLLGAGATRRAALTAAGVTP